MTDRPLRVGIAGLGRLGARHARMLATRVPGARLVAACSPVAEERAWVAREVGLTDVYATYPELLAHPGLDAVALVTPTTEHAHQIMEALAAGKHVFSEKPTSLTLEDCLRVEEAAGRHPDLKVLIGYVRRFDPSYREAFDSVTRGSIGDVFYVRSQTLDRNDPSGFFVRFAPTSGGIFLDMSVHDIDVARWFLGGARAERVFATGTIAVHEGLRACGDLDNGVALCEFEGGRIACFQASRTMAHGHDTETEVVGTSGRLTIGANARLSRVDIADAHGVRHACTPTFYERFEEAFAQELAAFVAAVQDDAPLPLTLRDATEATRIAIALQESLRRHAAIDL